MNYQFKINEFEGPLDLLLHLVKENKMDIYELNTTEIINQYLNYIHTMKDLNIDIASEYLVMASELVHLKSKLLLNLNEEDEEEFELNTEEDLKNKLLEYQKYKSLSDDFRLLEQKRGEVYTKLPENLNSFKEQNIDISNTMNINSLLEAFMEFLKRAEYNKPLNTKIAKKEYSVSDRIFSIRNILKQKKKLKFIELFDIMSKEYIVVTFLSVLEMTKNNEIIIKQSKNFDDIFIEEKE